MIQPLVFLLLVADVFPNSTGSSPGSAGGTPRWIRSLNNCIRKVLAMARMVAPDKGIPEEVLDHAKSDRERSFLDMRFNGVPPLNKEIAAPCSPR